MACEYTYSDKSGKRQTVDEQTIVARYAAGELSHLYPKGWTPPKTLNVRDKDLLNTLSIGESVPIRREFNNAKTAVNKVKALSVSKEYGRGIFKQIADFARKFGYRLSGTFMVADLTGDLLTKNGVNLGRKISDIAQRKAAEINTNLANFNKEINKFGTPTQTWNAVTKGMQYAQYDPRTPPKTDVERQIQKDYMTLSAKEKQLMDFMLNKHEQLYKDRVKIIADLSKEYGVDLSSQIPNKLPNYMALGREGNYVVSAYQTINGEETLVGMERDDNRVAIERLRQKMIEAFPDARVTTVRSWQEFDKPVLNTSQEDLIAKLRSKMNDKKVDEQAINDAENVLRDVFASLLVKKNDNLYERKLIYGANSNMYRMQLKAITNSVARNAALKYNTEIDKTVAETRDFIKEKSFEEGYDAVRAEEGLNSIAEAVRYQGGNGFLDSTANYVNMIGFATTIFGNPSTALLNLFSIPLFAQPDMQARHGLKALPVLAKATAEASRAGLKTLEQMTGDMKEVAEILERNNRLHFADARELMDLSKDQSPLIGKAMKYGGWPMSVAEQITNIAIGLAEYRLQKEKGLDGKAMEDAIVTAVNNGNFNNSSATKGKYTKLPLGRVAFMLKSYGITAVGMMLRDTSQVKKWVVDGTITPEEGKIALKRIVGVWTNHALAAGVMGLPWIVTQPLMAMLQAIDADDEEKDLSTENFMKKRIYDLVGAEMADFIIYGAAGAGVSARISLNDILVRSGGPQGNETWFDTFVNNITGPGITNIGRTSQLLSTLNDDFRTMPAEEAIAKFVKSLPIPTIANIFKGNAIYETGKAYAADGTKLAEGLTETDAFLQAIGFRPSKVAAAANERGAIKEELSKVDRQRANLMAAHKYLYQAVQNGMADPEVLELWRENADSYSERFPAKAITEDTIERSIKSINENMASLKVKFKTEEEQELAELLLGFQVDREEDEEPEEE